MSLLFETAPEEPEKKKARVRKTEEPAQAAQPAAIFVPTLPIQLIGKIDGHYQCLDESCGSMAMDIVDERRGQWRLECAVCGTGSSEPALVGHIQPKEQEFVFRDGRFAGQTISEALRHGRGEEYVRWAAKDHPRQAVRDACRTHLDTIRPAS
jgi:hypothetical protein